ncbi:MULTISPECIES: hypothetical protein [unclassified Mesorhizobium]|uniref:hypothetical protein n=1 Tax=unclassified Mesorhizobium TaxID=325217 RepID=UPI0033376622
MGSIIRALNTSTSELNLSFQEDSVSEDLHANGTGYRYAWDRRDGIEKGRLDLSHPTEMGLTFRSDVAMQKPGSAKEFLTFELIRDGATIRCHGKLVINNPPHNQDTNFDTSNVPFESPFRYSIGNLELLCEAAADGLLIFSTIYAGLSFKIRSIWKKDGEVVSLEISRQT